MTLSNTPKVFVIDDDVGVRMSVQGLLNAEGLNSELFVTAEEILHCRVPDGPSCLVLDVSGMLNKPPLSLGPAKSPSRRNVGK